jgi:hypothetical protein
LRNAAKRGDFSDLSFALNLKHFRNIKVVRIQIGGPMEQRSLRRPHAAGRPFIQEGGKGTKKKEASKNSEPTELLTTEGKPRALVSSQKRQPLLINPLISHLVLQSTEGPGQQGKSVPADASQQEN